MKSVWIGILVCQVFAAAAQKPEPIYSFARVQKPLSWYKQQAGLWKAEVSRDPRNARAWYNYYRVSRNLNRCDSTDRRTAEQKHEELQQLVEKMGRSIPESYEYNLCRWMAGGNNFKYLPYLKKAIALGEGHWEHLEDIVVWAETDRDIPKRDAACQKWKASGELSAGMLYYNANVLEGLPQNALLFTAGDNDTFPCWILQAQGIRKDVTVINTSLVHIDAYRLKLFAELGIPPFDLAKGPEGNLSEEGILAFEKGLIRHCTQNAKGFPVCVALTGSVNPSFLQDIQSHLYLTGLAYVYSTEPIDNMAILRRNFEQHYALDYLDKAFYPDISQGLVQEMNRNYLVPMLKLYEHYRVSGELKALHALKIKLLAIGKGTRDEALVNEYLNKPDGF